jgi:RND family efflux transporter MFP subunit
MIMWIFACSRIHRAVQGTLLGILLLPFQSGLTAEQAPVRVAIAIPEQAVITEELELTGSITAERRARLSPRVDGLVRQLKVDAGDRVKAGQVLIQLDDELAQHALQGADAQAAQAQARLAEAQRLVTEARRLVGEKHLPQTELERRESDLQLAQAQVQAAQASREQQAELVQRHALPAPFAGVVADRYTDVGEWITRGTPVIDLVATDRVRLDVQAPQEYFTRISKDAPVTVRVHGGSTRTLAGRISALVPIGTRTEAQGRESTRTFLVRVLIDETQNALLPGASATAEIRLKGSSRGFVVPRDALLRYPDGTHSVFVILEQQGALIARERRVRIGRGGQEVEVLEGLKPGERIVIRGNEMLRDGQAVEITNPPASSSGS